MLKELALSLTVIGACNAPLPSPKPSGGAGEVPIAELGDCSNAVYLRDYEANLRGGDEIILKATSDEGKKVFLDLVGNSQSSFDFSSNTGLGITSDIPGIIELQNEEDQIHYRIRYGNGKNGGTDIYVATSCYPYFLPGF